MESFFRLRISLYALHSPRSWSLYSQSSGNWYLKRSSVFSPFAQSSIMGPHALVFFLRSCTNVMNVTAAAVDEFGEAKACGIVSNGEQRARCTDLHARRVVVAVKNE